MDAKTPARRLQILRVMVLLCRISCRVSSINSNSVAACRLLRTCRGGYSDLSHVACRAGVEGSVRPLGTIGDNRGSWGLQRDYVSTWSGCHSILQDTWNPPAWRLGLRVGL